MHKIAKLLLSVILICSLLLSCFIISAENSKSIVRCPEYSFSLLNGSTVNNTTNSNKTAVLIFFQIGCSNSSTLIKSLAKANWVDTSKLSIIAIEINSVSNSELETYANTNGGNNINFATCKSSVASNFLNSVGHTGSSFSLPAVFVIDGENSIRHSSTGALSETNLRSVLSKYVDGLTAEPTSTVKFSGMYYYSKAFDVLNIVNAERQTEGLTELKMDSVLLDAAMKRAAECAVQFSHTRPDGSDAMSVIEANIFRENIASGQTSATEVMNSWMNSDGHKNNILNTDCDSIGIGVFWQNGEYYWTQVFSNQLGSEETTSRPNENSSVSILVLDSNLSFEASQSSVTLEKNTSKDIFACLNQSSVKLDHDCVNYSSSNKDVATISENGKITAVNQGTATITVSLKNSSKKDTVSITVVLPENENNSSNNGDNSSEQSNPNSSSNNDNPDNPSKPEETTPQPDTSNPNTDSDSSKDNTTESQEITSSDNDSEDSSTTDDEKSDNNNSQNQNCDKGTDSVDNPSDTDSNSPTSTDSNDKTPSKDNENNSNKNSSDGVQEGTQTDGTVGAETNTESSKNNVSLPETDTNNQATNNSVAIILIIVASILIIGGAGFLIWYFIIYKKKKETIE